MPRLLTDLPKTEVSGIILFVSWAQAGLSARRDFLVIVKTDDANAAANMECSQSLLPIATDREATISFKSVEVTE